MCVCVCVCVCVFTCNQHLWLQPKSLLTCLVIATLEESSSWLMSLVQVLFCTFL